MELRLTRLGKRKVTLLTRVMEAMDQGLRDAVPSRDLRALERGLAALHDHLAGPGPVPPTRP
jgi:hypothetical protein